MGGIKSISALPGDPTFSQTNNNYDIPSYNRICAEFGIKSSCDFLFKHGANHGLGKVFINISNHGYASTGMCYPGTSATFSDEGGKAEDGTLVQYILNGITADQFESFIPNRSSGLIQAGLARINQSIEALMYCILGAQVNVRSSILGDGGQAKEAQREFLVLIEDAVRQPDLSKSVQRYQMAVDQAKVRLDMAISPGTWLMPSQMVINTDSTVGYNNQLKQATPDMKLGVNKGVNKDTEKVGIKHMDGGPSKTNRPTSHPSNPIHKAAQQQGNKKKAPDSTSHKAAIAAPDEPQMKIDKAEPAHEMNKIWLMVGLSLLAGFAVSRAL